MLGDYKTTKFVCTPTLTFLNGIRNANPISDASLDAPCASLYDIPDWNGKQGIDESR